jgi:hypothetical protein
MNSIIFGFTEDFLTKPRTPGNSNTVFSFDFDLVFNENNNQIASKIIA